MTELSKDAIQSAAINAVESMQMEIDRLTEDNASAERENERLEARIAELVMEVEQLKKLIADSNAARLWPDIVRTATK